MINICLLVPQGSWMNVVSATHNRTKSQTLNLTGLQSKGLFLLLLWLFLCWLLCCYYCVVLCCYDCSLCILSSPPTVKSEEFNPGQEKSPLEEKKCYFGLSGAFSCVCTSSFLQSSSCLDVSYPLPPSQYKYLTCIVYRTCCVETRD